MILCFIYKKLTIITFFVIVIIGLFPIPRCARKIKKERRCYALWYRICVIVVAEIRHIVAGRYGQWHIAAKEVSASQKKFWIEQIFVYPQKTKYKIAQIRGARKKFYLVSGCYPIPHVLSGVGLLYCCAIMITLAYFSSCVAYCFHTNSNIILIVCVITLSSMMMPNISCL